MIISTISSILFSFFVFSYAQSLFPYIGEESSELNFSLPSSSSLSIVVLGASGDLSKRKTFPSIWALYREGLLPKNTKIYGVARAKFTNDEFRIFLAQNIKTEQQTTLQSFQSLCEYYSTPTYDGNSFEDLAKNILPKWEQSMVVDGGTTVTTDDNNNNNNRLFYLAIPPSLFISASASIKKDLFSSSGWNRIIIEKPFGHDSSSSSELSAALAMLFNESEIFRIDHYLAKEMTQNLLYLRFANVFFEAMWNKAYIKAVQIIMEEQIGTEGRGGYFDGYGIIRDVIQNHLIQLLSLIAMEQPEDFEPEHVRDKKVALLQQVSEMKFSETVLGQYIADKEGHLGYKDDPGVPPNSTAATFAQIVAWVNNSRWDGVPFILRAAKAVKQKRVEVRILFKNSPLFPSLSPNELIIRVQPEEAIIIRVINKEPGLSSNLVVSELDLTYRSKFKNIKYYPDAYDKLILDAIRGDHSLFVRVDELSEAWRICTPLLHQIHQNNVQPLIYEYGTNGPPEAEQQLQTLGWINSP